MAFVFAVVLVELGTQTLAKDPNNEKILEEIKKNSVSRDPKDYYYPKPRK